MELKHDRGAAVATLRRLLDELASPDLTLARSGALRPWITLLIEGRPGTQAGREPAEARRHSRSRAG